MSFSRKNTKSAIFSCNNIKFQKSNIDKIVRIFIDYELKFKFQIKNWCKKASEKIWALSCLTSYLNNSEKSWLIMQ